MRRYITVDTTILIMDALLDRQAIVIMPVDRSEIDPDDLADAEQGSLTDLVKQWDEN